MQTMSAELEAETIAIPAAVRFPVELHPPEGFLPEEPATWPRIPGRLEYVEGRFLYIPPCGHSRQVTTVSAVGILDRWLDDHRDFAVGGNEAVMVLGRDVRGAEGAVWRRQAVGPPTEGCIRVPPILAVEVAGRDSFFRRLV
jgi:hypothetical protein